MASGQDMQYIVIDDFSPGIWGDNTSVTTLPAPKGAAQMNTYGCVAGVNGSLRAGPQYDIGGIQQPLYDTPFDFNHYPDLRIRVVAANILSPIWRAVATGFAQDDLVFMFHSYWWDAGGTGVFANARCKIVAQVYSTQIGPIYTANTTTAVGNSWTTPVYGPANIDFSRANTTAPTTVGHPIAAMVAMNVGQQTFTGSQNIIYPAAATIGANSRDDISGLFPGIVPNTVFAHQDRLVFVSGTGNEITIGPQVVAGETVQFSNVNNYNVISGTNMFVAEAPNGFGSFMTQNASTAVFIKRNSGGYIISGPLEQPTITRLPSIPGADPPNLPARLNDGTVVYGNRQGMWQWSGGDTAQLISRQLPNNFWINTTYDGNTWKTYAAMAGRSTFVDPFVWVPNNWLYDTRSTSWWRLGALSGYPQFAYYLPTSDGRILAVPFSFDNSNLTVIWPFSYTVFQNDYTWTSQPLQESVNRELNFREFNITAQSPGGTSSIIITLYDLMGNVITTTPTITVSTTYPYTQSIPIGNVPAHDVYFKIDAHGPGSTAPEIFRIALGYHEEETARR